MANTHSQAVRVLRRRAGARPHLTTVHRSVLPEAKHSPSAGTGRPFSGDPATALGLRPASPRVQLPSQPLERIPTAPPARHTIVLDAVSGELYFRDEETDPHPLDRLEPTDIAWDFPSAIAPAQQVNIATELESLFQDVLDAKFRGEDVAPATEAVAGALSQAEGDLRFYDADGWSPELGWQAVDEVLELMDERAAAASAVDVKRAIPRELPDGFTADIVQRDEYFDVIVRSPRGTERAFYPRVDGTDLDAGLAAIRAWANDEIPVNRKNTEGAETAVREILPHRFEADFVRHEEFLGATVRSPEGDEFMFHVWTNHSGYSTDPDLTEATIWIDAEWTRAHDNRQG